MVALFFALLSLERILFPESRVGSHVSRFADVTTDTAFDFHSGTSGSEGYRAIVSQSAGFSHGQHSHTVDDLPVTEIR